MKLHKRLITLVGLGMLLVITITVSALQEMASVFTRTTMEIENTSRKHQQIWEIESRIGEMNLAAHGIAEDGDEQYRASYRDSRTAVHDAFRSINQMLLGLEEMKILGSLMRDFRELEQKSERIITYSTKEPAKRMLVRNMLLELDSLHAWMRRDLDRYKEEYVLTSGRIIAKLHNDKIRISMLVILILGTSLSFLFTFGYYLFRKVSVPLNELWIGTEAIIDGHLDHRIPVHAGSDIARLSERFNIMAQNLKQSYEDLEQRLLSRTRHLAALDSVALTLGKSGNLDEILHRSLLLVLEKLSDLEPRGGIFLCDADGEHLRLLAHAGLPREFVEQEETIKMGECLCGQVAQQGEILYSEKACTDSRHTRLRGSGDHDHAHIIVPLKSRGVVLGVMFLYPAKTFTMKPSDLQLLDSIGTQLGMAVENHRFYSEVKESSEKYWDLFENSRDILCILDDEGRFTVLNKAAEEFLGVSRIELVGKSVFAFLREQDAAAVRKVLEGEVTYRLQTFEFDIVKPNGSIASVEVSGRALAPNRLLGRFQISVRDVTEQKRIREMLMETERLAAICQVGVAVRHEINNPLTTVIGNVELLLEQLAGTDDDLKKRLEAVLKNSLRIAEIVKQLEGIKKDKVVEYLQGVKMTDLKQG